MRIVMTGNGLMFRCPICDWTYVDDGGDVDAAIRTARRLHRLGKPNCGRADDDAGQIDWVARASSEGINGETTSPTPSKGGENQRSKSQRVQASA